MSSLREVKDRIGSVRSTLKITSAMKLVASSKLLKAQRAIENLRPYAETLEAMVREARGGTQTVVVSENCDRPWPHERGGPASEAEVFGDNTAAVEPRVSSPTVVLAFSSNSSMCGAFNANAIKKALAVIRGIHGPVEVWAFGRKIADGLRKEGLPAARDYSSLIGKPDFDAVAAVAAEIRQLSADGRISGALMVFNHFVSTGRQEVVVQDFLSGHHEPVPVGQDGVDTGDDDAFIIEPTKDEFLEALAPLVSNLKLYAALLDSVASEHAARMIAMQMATDNAQDLLAELTLEYNKGRQQKITSEILDLVSGEAQA